MHMWRDSGPSLILAALRGFCLFFVDTLSDYRQKKPLGTSIPPRSGSRRLKFANTVRRGDSLCHWSDSAGLAAC